jgi:hypothetical protein
MRRQLFPGGDNFKIEYCANCGRHLSVKYSVTIGDEKFKVCSLDCETKLRSKDRNSSQEFIFSEDSLSKDEK